MSPRRASPNPQCLVACLEEEEARHKAGLIPLRKGHRGALNLGGVQASAGRGTLHRAQALQCVGSTPRPPGGCNNMPNMVRRRDCRRRDRLVPRVVPRRFLHLTTGVLSWKTSTSYRYSKMRRTKPMSSGRQASSHKITLCPCDTRTSCVPTVSHPTCTGRLRTLQYSSPTTTCSL